MKTIKVSEATGPALDWLVAKCEHPKTFNSHSTLRSIGSFRYSTDWAIGGRIIAREMLERPTTAGEQLKDEDADPYR